MGWREPRSRKTGRFLLLAQSARFSLRQRQHPTGFVTGVNAVRSARFDRDDLGIEGLRPIHRCDTTARQRVQRVERERSRVTRARVVGELHHRAPAGGGLIKLDA